MEPKDQKLFVFCDPEIQQLFLEYDIDLVKQINKSGLEVKHTLASNPAEENNESRFKDPTTVLLASAAVIVAITPIITKIIENISHKTVLVEEMSLVPVEDSQGEIVRDSANRPILYWKEESKILESTKTNTRNEFNINGLGIRISFKNSE